MNETTAAAANQSSVLGSSSYGTLTGINLGLIALFAVLVLIAIGYGAKLHRQRKQAEQTVEQHAAEAGVPAVPAAPAEPSLPADTGGAIAAERTAPPDADTAPASSPVEPIAPAERTFDSEPAIHAEPIPAAAPLDASPAAEAASPPDQPPSPANGSVTQLKGLGPKVAARLAELGITTVGQVAALTDDQADALDAQLGSFRGRMARDRWIEQARFLATGDRAGFESVFGKL